MTTIEIIMFAVSTLIFIASLILLIRYDDKSVRWPLVISAVVALITNIVQYSGLMSNAVVYTVTVLNLIVFIIQIINAEKK